MEPIVYRPADIALWLEMGAQTVRKASNFEAPEDLKTMVTGALGAIVGHGGSVLADVTRQKLSGWEFRLYEDRLERPNAGSPRTVPYEDIKRIDALKHCEYKVVCSKEFSFVIKPYAWLSVTGVSVPMGWLRDGLGVPFELLAEELSARSRASLRV